MSLWELLGMLCGLEVSFFSAIVLLVCFFGQLCAVTACLLSSFLGFLTLGGWG